MVHLKGTVRYGMIRYAESTSKECAVEIDREKSLCIRNMTENEDEVMPDSVTAKKIKERKL